MNREQLELVEKTKKQINKLNLSAELSFLTMEAQMYRFKYQIN